MVLLDRPLATITPTVDGDVLGVLAAADSRFTTGQIHRILGRFSEHGIRKVLTRLAAQGVVLAEPFGNAVAYSLNRDHLSAGPIIELTNARTVLLRRLTDLIEGWNKQPLFAAVFGSAVRGAMSLDSDIDILVVHRDGESELDWDVQRLDLDLKVWRWTGNRAEVLPMTESELRDRGSDHLLSDVRAFGSCVGGDREWFERALRAAPKR